MLPESAIKPITRFLVVFLTAALPGMTGLACSDAEQASRGRDTGTASSAPAAQPNTTPVRKTPEKKLDRKKLDATLAEAAGAFKSADFDTAKEKYSEAIEMASLRPALEKKNIALARRMIKRCDVYLAILSDVRPEIFGDRKMIYSFTMYSGRRFVAKVLGRDEGSISVLKENGTSGVLLEDDVMEEKPLDENAYLEHLVKKLRDDESEAEKQKNYFAFFNCVYFAAQHKLTKEITRLLERTFSCKGSEDLLSIFCPDDYVSLSIALLESYGKKKELLEFRMRLGLAKAEDKTPKPKTGPLTSSSGGSEISGEDTQPAGEPETPKLVAKVDAPKPRPKTPESGTDTRPEKKDPDGIDRFGETVDAGGEPDIAATSRVSRGSGALRDNPDFLKAQKLLNLARLQYRLSMPGRPDAAEHAKKAQEILERALDLVNPLMDKHENDYELEQLGQQIAYLLHAIIKNRGI